MRANILYTAAIAAAFAAAFAAVPAPAQEAQSDHAGHQAEGAAQSDSFAGMQALMERARKADSRAERIALMREHAQLMRDHMARMHAADGEKPMMRPQGDDGMAMDKDAMRARMKGMRGEEGAVKMRRHRSAMHQMMEQFLEQHQLMLELMEAQEQR